MLELNECRQHLKGLALSDEDLLTLRNYLYNISEKIIRRHENLSQTTDGATDSGWQTDV